MTTKKQVAQSLKDMAASNAMSRILNFAEPVDDLTETLLEHWSYDLFSRSPGPAYFENGALQPTDLDLACFLSALVDRKAVISLPRYEARRAKTTREGEHIVGNGGRHGKVMGLTANKEVFSFSIRINDMSVITSGGDNGEDTVGAPRNFMLVDVDGKWHNGWERIEFLPSAKENAFLHDKKLWTGNTVVFKNFVHPNRWVSFYGQYYFMTKALIARLETEATFRRAEEKRLLAEGASWPSGSNDGKLKEYAPSEKGESKPITVGAFEVEIDAPWAGTLAPVKAKELLDNRGRVRELQYNILPRLRFATRATELAFVEAGATTHKMPAWIKNAEWTGQTIGRTEWSRLVLTQLMPGQIGFALRCRQYTKTERVAA